MMLGGKGESYKGRMHEMEFSSHYDAEYTPIIEFGHRFFDDWDEKEWLRFDNLMIYCIHYFLKHGLVDYKKINVEARKLNELTDQTFYEFMKQNVEVNQIYQKVP